MNDQQRPENPFRVTQPTPPAAAPASMPVPQVAPAAASPAMPAAPAQEKKQGKGGTVMLWLCAAFGAYMTVFSAFDVRYSVVYALGGVLLGLAITLGFGWPLYCRSRDRKALAAWEKDRSETRELSALLTSEDTAIAQALAPRPRPEPMPRNWKKVGTAVAIITVLGGVLISAGDAEYRENNPDAVTSTET
ncbi:hypothetical protein [Corynebacterium variabile]|uniref:hypothetical protein n=1 Tax=Corynebacterium variabile TaxID=1727 RepID=UPI0028983599|nr:hypothetical protein [Corynebacterium variabile]